MKMRLGRRPGFSLVEVMVSTVLFAVVASSIFGLSAFTTNTTYGNLDRNAAFNAAEGVLQQLGSLRFADLDAVYKKTGLYADGRVNALCFDRVNKTAGRLYFLVNGGWVNLDNQTGNVDPTTGLDLGDRRVPANVVSASGAEICLTVKMEVRVVPVNDAAVGVDPTNPNAYAVKVDYSYLTRNLSQNKGAASPVQTVSVIRYRE